MGCWSTEPCLLGFQAQQELSLAAVLLTTASLLYRQELQNGLEAAGHWVEKHYDAWAHEEMLAEISQHSEL